ncbi:cellulose biosynthesis cyclic di-GMP-binding regulatory protein BcsB [Spongiibacter tropicus]|uniref:cellulose biosynthesis cyclic di-GMP-binding regulatory protein BcsB n=1 Tax=Spongiibacter tropicus TaxID=454602 RepID=UPI0035BE49B9
MTTKRQRAYLRPLQTLAALLVLSGFSPAQAQGVDVEQPPLEESRYSLQDLGYGRSAKLRGSESSVSLNFGSRLDELVEAAELHLNYSASPALMAKLSHLKVYLNGELMGVTAIDDESRLQRNTVIPLQPRYLSDFNQLRVELIGHLDKDCWSPDDVSIWSELGASTELRLFSRALPLANDLALLPAPFFDGNDYRSLELPVVMSGENSLERLRAAGIGASWFGAQAAWRGASFPVTDTLPEQHALVLMTNSQRPEALQDYPPVEGPTLEVMALPDRPEVKYLLVQGRDDADLVEAMKGLAIGSALLSGSVAEIRNVKQLKPRKPYDAPNWLPTDRPVRFGELVNDPSQLQVSGRTPAPVSLSFQLPPDLFTWRSRGIPVDLQYHYSPPIEDDNGSQLSMLVNGQFVEAYHLTRSGVSGELNSLRVPLLDDSLLGNSQLLRIPAFKVGSRNQLLFEFDFAGIANGECKSIPPARRYAVVDADSTLDFTGFPHYIEMPNLRAFSNAAYPFTRMADLSETAVLLPQPQNAQVVETYLQMMGFAGSSAGYPALGVSLLSDWDKSQLQDKDVLLIAANPSLDDIADDELPLLIKEANRSLLQPRSNRRIEFAPEGGSGPDLAKSVSQVQVRANGPFSAMVGMRSPFDRDRSVVSLLASAPGDFADLRDSLADSGKVPFMYGTVVTVRGEQVASFNVGDKYFVGKLRVWDLIWFHFSRHPVILGLISAVICLMLAVVLWRILSGVARRRLYREGA